MSLLCMVKVREVYGNLVAYPGNATAEAFARIAGTKTLTPDVLREIQQLAEVRYSGGELAIAMAMKVNPKPDA